MSTGYIHLAREVRDGDRLPAPPRTVRIVSNDLTVVTIDREGVCHVDAPTYVTGMYATT